MWAVVALFFLVIAASKALWGGHELAVYLDNSAMFPVGWSDPLVASIIALEFLIALLLLWRSTRRAGWLLTAGTCSAFAMFHIFAALFGFAKMCSCIMVQLSHNGRTNNILMSVICLLLVGISAWMLRRTALGPKKELIPCALLPASV